MAAKDGISQYEAIFLERVSKVVAELGADLQTASAEEIIARLCDQPFAVRPVVGADGQPREARVLMALEPGAPPQRIANGLMINTITSSSGMFQIDLPTQEPTSECVGLQGLLPIEAFRSPLREVPRLFEDALRFDRDRDAAARQRLEDRVRPVWDRTVMALPDFGAASGARVWTTGAEGVVAHAGHTLLHNPGLRKRARLCVGCGNPLFTLPGPGRIREACETCKPSDAARDARKRLRDALAEVACPEPHSVAALALREGFWTIEDLRHASHDSRFGAAVQRAVRRSRPGVGQREIVVTLNSIFRRLRTTPIHGASGEPGWGRTAFEELELAVDPIPSEAEIHRAGERFLKRVRDLRDSAFAAQVLDDALAFRLVLCRRRRSPK